MRETAPPLRDIAFQNKIMLSSHNLPTNFAETGGVQRGLLPAVCDIDFDLLR